MGWKWFRFMRVATAATLPTLNEASPAWAQDTKKLNIHDGTEWKAVPFESDFAGMIMAFGNTAAPTGWLSCDGTAVSRSTYAKLYAAIGTKWGVGDGSTTFNLPDLRGAYLRGTGTHGTATMADGNKYAGPAVAATQNDAMQGHYHSLYTDAGYTNLQGKGAAGTALSTYVVGNTSADVTTMQVTAARADPSNGTPRIGSETTPFAAGVLWCIKY